MAVLRNQSGELIYVDAHRLSTFEQLQYDQIKGSTPRFPIVFFREGKPVGVLASEFPSDIIRGNEWLLDDVQAAIRVQETALDGLGDLGTGAGNDLPMGEAPGSDALVRLPSEHATGVCRHGFAGGGAATGDGRAQAGGGTTVRTRGAVDARAVQVSERLR